MNTVNPKVLPAPPNFISSLMAGFDSITNHLVLILFPLIFDIILWLGPHLRLSALINGILNTMESLPGGNSPEFSKLLEANRELMAISGDHYNLLSILRTYPVGIPSLMISIQPISTPINEPYSVQVLSIWVLFGLWVLFSVLGMAIGAFYFGIVAQAAISGKIKWGDAIMRWPWVSAQVWLLAILWFAIIVALSVPSSCVITALMTAGGASIGRIGTLIFMGMVLWLLFPLIFSSHGIFVRQQKMWQSVKAGVQMTRYTFPNTALFIFIILVLGEGLDMLWRIPGEKSWLTIIGIAGHGFISSGILASTFIYYRDATSWVEQVFQKIRLSSVA